MAVFDLIDAENVRAKKEARTSRSAMSGRTVIDSAQKGLFLPRKPCCLQRRRNDGAGACTV